MEDIIQDITSKPAQLAALVGLLIRNSAQTRPKADSLKIKKHYDTFCSEYPSTAYSRYILRVAGRREWLTGLGD